MLSQDEKGIEAIHWSKAPVGKTVSPVLSVLTPNVIHTLRWTLSHTPGPQRYLCASPWVPGFPPLRQGWNVSSGKSLVFTPGLDGVCH